jgi:hypothetical protein
VVQALGNGRPLVDVAATVESVVPRGDLTAAGLWCARYDIGLAIVGWLGHEPARQLTSHGRVATAATARRLCALAGRQSFGPAG